MLFNSTWVSIVYSILSCRALHVFFVSRNKMCGPLMERKPLRATFYANNYKKRDHLILMISFVRVLYALL